MRSGSSAEVEQSTNAVSARKEALHIQKTPANNRLNCRDRVYKLPGYWIVTKKKLDGRVNPSHTSANHVSASRGGSRGVQGIATSPNGQSHNINAVLLMCLAMQMH